MSDIDGVSAVPTNFSEPRAKILVLVIVGKDDKPLLIQDISTPGWRPDPPHLASFVAHQALDIIEDIVWTNPNMYLKEVDVFDCLAVSAYVTCSHLKLILITSAAGWTAPSGSLSQNMPPPPSYESIRLFFRDVQELYCKQLLNPLYTPNETIISKEFNLRVQKIARKHLY
ncbi:SNARE like protein [Babesia gibsoni]|uniref:SNARE like protein n=1 Tax=Babesia gibsoni TaxID=33632 RepID=A0AAD8PFS6_BABGI|nr:SNARE like protein [Babesia gibsoni]